MNFSLLFQEYYGNNFIVFQVVCRESFFFFFFSVNASFLERFLEKCSTLHSDARHLYQEEFEYSFHTWKYL